MIMNKSFVSIITPCYNAERTIVTAIESVINQSFQNWEMLIIDDCSNDSSPEIIKEYADRDHRIKYFQTNEKSGSPSLPRNIGIDNACGKYIAFLDADDIWLPNKLEQQIQFIENNDYSFIYSDYEKINHLGERNNRIVKMPESASFWDVIETCTIPCLTALIKREIIGDTRFKHIPKEDFVFWLDILKKEVIAYNVGQVLALYREQPNSRSSNKFNMIKNQRIILRKIEGVKPVVASYFMFQYLFHGVLKFIK